MDYILQLALFRQLPSRMLSRTWGEITSKELPKWCRRPVLGLYVWAFGCDMEEALIEDIREYPSLSKLFTRQLKEGARVVDSECLVVSSSYLCWHVVSSSLLYFVSICLMMFTYSQLYTRMGQYSWCQEVALSSSSFTQYLFLHALRI